MDRLLGRITYTDGGCWEWTSSPDTHGYGRLKINRRLYLAHRLSYELFVGPIPDGMQIDHLCRVRRCVNPAHMEAVTARENVARGEGPSAAPMRTGYCKRGHLFAGDNLLLNSRKTGAYTCRACRDERRLLRAAVSA